MASGAGGESADRVRLIAVLGYSERSGGTLHPVCAARLARAEREVVGPGDIVVLSGWAKRGAGVTEAELMARAWTGDPRRVILDCGARSTAGNAVGIARTVRRAGAREVVLVTSGWHARRAAVLVRAALADPSVNVTLATTDEPGGFRARVREVACWPAVPFLAIRAARTR